MFGSSKINRMLVLLDYLESSLRGDITVCRDVSMASKSAWQAGGRVRAIVTVETTEALAMVVRLLEFNGQKWAIIGNTSNLLFIDEPIDGVLLKLGDRMRSITYLSDGRLLVGAAAWVPAVARHAALLELSGIEHTIGIPGTFGGLVVMNGGSARQCISESISEVCAVSTAGDLVRLDASSCGFSRRVSIFQTGDYVITKVALILQPGRPYRSTRPELLKTLRTRRAKFPMRLPNCGSVFVSDPRTYAAYGPPGALIESCGLKGLSKGGAQISTQHANFIVNRGGRACDILELIRTARAAVFEKYGVLLRSEVKVVTANCEIVPADNFISAYF